LLDILEMADDLSSGNG